MNEIQTAINNLYPEADKAMVKAEREILVGRIKDQVLRAIDPQLPEILENIIKLFIEIRNRVRLYVGDHKLNKIEITVAATQLVLTYSTYPVHAIADFATDTDPGPPENEVKITLTENSFQIEDMNNVVTESDASTLNIFLRDFERRLRLAAKPTTAP